MILLVDDEPRKMDSYILELKFSGYEVEFKQDVDSAFKYIHKNASKLDLIVLDILMPPGEITKNMDTNDGLRTGVCFLELIRKELSVVPIFIFTNTYINDDPKFDKIIKEDKNIKLLYKTDNLPFELAEKVQNILAG